MTLPAPPYFRLFLGARVMHEWGHLAHAAKFLRVPDENKLAYKEARAELGDCFSEGNRSDTGSNAPQRIKETAGLVAMLEPPSSPSSRVRHWRESVTICPI